MDKLANNPKFQGFDSNGVPLSGGKLYTYEVGTTTNKTTYTDRVLTTANANPVVLDSRGEGVVYFSGTIKFVLKDSSDVTIWTMDNLAIDDAITSLLGFAIRANFTWKDADEIYINPGVYEINGKIVQWSSQLTSDIGSPDVSDWYYLYLDDSAIGTASKTLTASDFIWSKTEPAWSNAKHGWYNSADRCILGVLTDGSSNILEFFHEGDIFKFADHIVDLSNSEPTDNTWVDDILTMPAFAKIGLVTFEQSHVSAAGSLWWRTNDQSGSVGHYVTQVAAGTTEGSTYEEVMTDSAETIEIKTSLNSDSQVTINTHGYRFPIGM